MAATEVRSADVVLTGDIDVATAPKVREVLIEAIESSTTGRIVVHCHDVDFIDSMGLSALVSARNHAREISREIVLVSPNERVAKVLELTGLDAVFPVIDD